HEGGRAGRVAATEGGGGMSEVVNGTMRRWRKYAAYVPCQAGWLREMPAQWKARRADACLTRTTNPVDPKALASDVVFHYSIPASEATGDGVLEPVSHIDSNKLLLSGSELLISRLNPRKSRVLLARGHDVPTVCSSEFVVLVPGDCHPEYACYLFGSEPVRQYLSAHVDSVTRSHQRVNPEVITKCWFAWPSLPEQRSIAAFLDRETARIDELIEKKERTLALLEEKRQAVISRVVTRGTNAGAESKDSGVPTLGKVPAHWTLCALKRTWRSCDYGLSESLAGSGDVRVLT